MWKADLQIVSTDKSVEWFSGEMAAGNTNNKAYLLRGSFADGVHNSNHAGASWLLVYDVDTSDAVKMESVLLLGLSVAGESMYITEAGILAFH